MRFAAVNFDAAFANVDENLKRAGESVREAAAGGAGVVVLPEFFASSMGRAPQMLEVVPRGADVEAWLRRTAARYDVAVGGSYLRVDGEDARNVFELVFPNGEVFAHAKDIPTIGENCYYTGGDEDHVLRTPIGDFGVALCWEMLRCDTLRRLSGKVDVVLAGSCWEDLRDGAPLKEYNREFALRTPVDFARLLRVPVVHANHCGSVTAVDFYDETAPFTYSLVGATQILDEHGLVIGRRTYDEGPGLVVADIDLEESARRPADVPSGRYWIPDLPDAYAYAWETYSRSRPRTTSTQRSPSTERSRRAARQPAPGERLIERGGVR